MKFCSKWLSLIYFQFFIAGFLVFLLVIPSIVGAQPHKTRTGANLVPNAKIGGSDGWSVAWGATYDPTVSRTSDGSGSLNIGKEGALVGSSKMPVESGKTYTYSLYLKEEGLLPGTIRIFIKIFSSSGAYIRNASGTNQGIVEKNTWYESSVIVSPKQGEAFVQVLATRLAGESPGVNNTWVDDFYVGEGIGFEQPPTPKKEFSGSKVRVDALGNMEVFKNNSWKPFFPMCMFADNGRPNWTIYSEQGFNCNMWAAGVGPILKAKNATSSFNPDGMMSAFEVAPYTTPLGWGYNRLDWMLTALREINDAGLSDDILMYYWDNENAYDQWDVPKNVFEIIKEEDTVNGERMHPIYALQGNHGVARMYNNSSVQMTDVVGTYTLTGNDGGAGGSAAGFIILDNIQGQGNPVVIAQINAGTGSSFRHVLYDAIIQGAKGLGFWRDFYSPSQGKSVDQRTWWPDFPSLRREIDQLLPIIRKPHWTSWALIPPQGETNISFGTRDYQGEGFVILTNKSSSSKTVTFTIQGLSYQPQKVHDFFTENEVTNVSNGSFTVTLPGKGVGKGTAVYRLAGAGDAGNPAPSPPQGLTFLP